jgi:hypothetical protein
MKYALLIYTDPAADASVSEAEYAAIHDEYMAIREDPGCVDGAHLQPVQTATTVRVSDGETLITDGPFAETKEVFGGFFLVEAADLDAATEIAERIPAARLGGSVEIRPLAEVRSAVAEA